jgi:hypothetical protein
MELICLSQDTPTFPTSSARFSVPSLMGGEDEQAYAALYARVEELVRPNDVWDQMMVSDVVNHFWEQQRYRHSTGAIINAGRRSALKKILREAIGLNQEDATEVADLYFGVTRYEETRRVFYCDPAVIPKTRTGAIALLKKHGFTESDIDRLAMEASVDTLAGLENLALKHELRREAILCELERRREHRARQQLSAPPRQLDRTGNSPTKDLPNESSPSLRGPRP